MGAWWFVDGLVVEPLNRVTFQGIKGTVGAAACVTLCLAVACVIPIPCKQTDSLHQRNTSEKESSTSGSVHDSAHMHEKANENRGLARRPPFVAEAVRE